MAKKSPLTWRVLASGLRDAGTRSTLAVMSGDRAIVLAIVGTGVAVITVVVTVLSMQIAGVNTRIDDVNTRIDDVNMRVDDVRSDIRDLRADHVRFEQRLDRVALAFGKVEQRLETLERVILPSREPAGN